ncbi:MAG: hypothetical protein AVDCRST_MAG83-625, partial [uncultured Arthrobacter sp.]
DGHLLCPHVCRLRISADHQRTDSRHPGASAACRRRAHGR